MHGQGWRGLRVDATATSRALVVQRRDASDGRIVRVVVGVLQRMRINRVFTYAFFAVVIRGSPSNYEWRSERCVYYAQRFQHKGRSD